MTEELKITKSEAGYGQAFVGQIVCWLCRHLREGMQCARVVGTVERTTTCDNAEHILKLRKGKAGEKCKS